jgi:myosin heavy subunit
LDIFGFESFPINGFEQLCINYCNEKLQQKFTQDIFRTVQEEYTAEGLNLDDIKYDDNSDVLELIEGKFGIIKQLNEECVRPKGNDQAFVSKALTSNKSVPCLIIKPTFSRIEFGIHHFAGPVVYRAQEFVIRNTDTLPADLKSAAAVCSNDIISKHLENNKCSNYAKPEGAEASRAAPKRAKSNLSADTVMTQFKNQLASLMKGLAETSSRYIRCVKPNTLKAKLVMQHVTTMEQLRCAGVIAAVIISRSAYPNRLDLGEVVELYGMLNEGKPKAGYPDVSAEVDDMCNKLLKENETEKKDGSIAKGYAMGKTRCYFRAGCLEKLESLRSKIWDKWAVKCQRIARGFTVRAREERIARELAERLKREKEEAEALAKKLKEEKEAAEKAAADLAYQIANKDRLEAEAAAQKIIDDAAAAAKAIKDAKDAAELKEKTEREAAELEEKTKREAAEKKKKDAREAKELKEKTEREAAEVKEKAEREEREAREKAQAEKDAKEKKEREEKELFEKYRNAIIPMQCFFRVTAARMKFAIAKRDKKRMKRMGKKSKKSAIRIQACVRGFVQRPKYRAALIKKKEEADLGNQLNKMEDKLQQAEDERKRGLEDAKFQFEQEMEEYKEKLEDQLRAEGEKKNKSAQQQTLIDESGKIIEYLRKENMKLRQQCESVKRDYKSLKENNARLMEANASASGSFNQLNEHAKGLNATNARLIKNVDTYKTQLVKMKEDLKNRQAFYLAEAHARVAYQKTLAKIVAQVQDKSRDAQLVEDVVIWALECEAEAKSERAALESAGQRAPPGAVNSMPSKASHRPTDSDSDSDSD